MSKKEAISDRLAKNLPQKHKKPDQALIDKRDIKDDYEFSRSIYRDLIKTGSLSLDTLAELARESEHPRAFEVLSNSIKNIGDVTDKLMALQKVKKALDQEYEQGRITNNNVFVGSTTELQRMLLDKNEVIDVEPENKE